MGPQDQGINEGTGERMSRVLDGGLACGSVSGDLTRFIKVPQPLEQPEICQGK